MAADTMLMMSDAGGVKSASFPTAMGGDGGMAIGGSITISSGIGTATSGNIGVTSDEPAPDAHNDDMAVAELGGLPRGAMPDDDDDDDDDGGDRAHAKSSSDPPEGRAGEDVVIAWDFLGKEGERSAMTRDRVALLEGAGFVWEARNGRGGASSADNGRLHDVQSGDAGRTAATVHATAGRKHGRKDGKMGKRVEVGSNEGRIVVGRHRR